MTFWQKYQEQDVSPAPDPPAPTAPAPDSPAPAPVDEGTTPAPQTAPPAPISTGWKEANTNRVREAPRIYGTDTNPLRVTPAPPAAPAPVHSFAVAAPPVAVPPVAVPPATPQNISVSEAELREILRVLHAAAGGDFSVRLTLPALLSSPSPSPSPLQTGDSPVHQIQAAVNQMLIAVESRLAAPPAVVGAPVVAASPVVAAPVVAAPPVVDAPVVNPLVISPAAPAPDPLPVSSPALVLSQSPLADLLDAQERLDEVTAIYMELYEHLHTTTRQISAGTPEGEPVPLETIQAVEQKLRELIAVLETTNGGMRRQIELAAPLADRLADIGRGAVPLGESVQQMRGATDELKRLMGETATALATLKGAAG